MEGNYRAGLGDQLTEWIERAHTVSYVGSFPFSFRRFHRHYNGVIERGCENEAWSYDHLPTDWLDIPGGEPSCESNRCIAEVSVQTSERAEESCSRVQIPAFRLMNPEGRASNGLPFCSSQFLQVLYWRDS